MRDICLTILLLTPGYLQWMHHPQVMVFGAPQGPSVAIWPGWLAGRSHQWGTACFLNSLVCLAHLQPCGETLMTRPPRQTLVPYSDALWYPCVRCRMELYRCLPYTTSSRVTLASSVRRMPLCSSGPSFTRSRPTLDAEHNGLGMVLWVTSADTRWMGISRT